MGTNKIPLYSCACHKSNKAVRAANKNEPMITAHFKELSIYASSARKTFLSLAVPNLNKCWLGTEKRQGGLINVVSTRSSDVENW